VPAAAVIPAPRVYIKVVAVKKLVVGLWSRAQRSPSAYVVGIQAERICSYSRNAHSQVPFGESGWFRRVYFE
jgi:hypothetical protein